MPRIIVGAILALLLQLSAHAQAQTPQGPRQPPSSSVSNTVVHFETCASPIVFMTINENNPSGFIQFDFRNSAVDPTKRIEILLRPNVPNISVNQASENYISITVPNAQFSFLHTYALSRFKFNITATARPRNGGQFDFVSIDLGLTGYNTPCP